MHQNYDDGARPDGRAQDILPGEYPAAQPGQMDAAAPAADHDLIGLAPDGSNAAEYLDQFGYDALQRSQDAEAEMNRPCTPWLDRQVRELILQDLAATARSGRHRFLFDNTEPQPGIRYNDSLFAGDAGDVRALTVLPIIAQQIRAVRDNLRDTEIAELRQLQNQLQSLANEYAQAQAALAPEQAWHFQGSRGEALHFLNGVVQRDILEDRTNRTSPEHIRSLLLVPHEALTQKGLGFLRKTVAGLRGRSQEQPATVHPEPVLSYRLQDATVLSQVLDGGARTPFQIRDLRNSQYFDRWRSNEIADRLIDAVQRNPWPLIARICGITPAQLERTGGGLVLAEDQAIMLLAIADTQWSLSGLEETPNALLDTILADYGLAALDDEDIESWKQVSGKLFENSGDLAIHTVQQALKLRQSAAGAGLEGLAYGSSLWEGGENHELFTEVIEHDQAFNAAKLEFERVMSKLGSSNDQLRRKVDQIIRFTQHWRNSEDTTSPLNKVLAARLFPAIARAINEHFGREHKVDISISDQQRNELVAEILGIQGSDINRQVTSPIHRLLVATTAGSINVEPARGEMNVQALIDTFRTDTLPRLLVGLEAGDDEVRAMREQLKNLFAQGSVEYAKMRELMKD